MDTISELIDTVDRRTDLLECLAECPKDKRTLVGELPVSRSTVDRGVRRLETHRLITYGADGYRLTLYGEFVVAEFRRFADRLESLAAARDLLGSLTLDCGLDPAVVLDAELILPVRAAPHLPGTYVDELLDGADRCRALGRAHSHRSAVDVLHEQVTERGMRTEVVMREDLFRYAHSSYPDKLATWVDEGNVDVFVVDTVPFGLFLIESRDRSCVCVLVYDDGDRLEGTIMNDSERAIDWGERVYDEYRRKATPASL